MRALGALLLAACTGGPSSGEPPESPKAPAAPASASPPAEARATETFTAPARPWTAATVHALALSGPAAAPRTYPRALPVDDTLKATMARLDSIVRRHAADPANPWAIAHGMTALGPDFPLSNGKNSVDWLFERYAEPVSAEGRTYLRFPAAEGEIRIEPHASLILKTFVETGVPPSRAVTVQGAAYTVGDVYRGELLSSYLVPQRNHSSFTSPNDLPWALSAFVGWAPPGPLAWVALDGTPMSLDDFATFEVTVLATESQFLFDAMKAGASFKKERQGIFGYTCGGAHLLQGAADAVARGRSTKTARLAVDAQVPLHFWRLPKELEIYDAAMKAAPQHSTVLLVQRLKFLGHWLESATKMAALGLYTPTDEQHRLVAGAAQQITLVVQALDQSAVYDGMDALRKTDGQLYLDLIGDSAHALHGLKLATGADGVH